MALVLYIKNEYCRALKFSSNLQRLPAVNYYHKVLHLECWSSSRSTSEFSFYFKSLFAHNLKLLGTNLAIQTLACFFLFSVYWVALYLKIALETSKYWQVLILNKNFPSCNIFSLFLKDPLQILILKYASNIKGTVMQMQKSADKWSLMCFKSILKISHSVYNFAVVIYPWN